MRDFGKILYRPGDGSYVIDNGMYHVPMDGDFSDLWLEVDTYAKEHPNMVEDDLNLPKN